MDGWMDGMKMERCVCMDGSLGLSSCGYEGMDVNERDEHFQNN